jgi:hypothetical protein
VGSAVFLSNGWSVLTALHSEKILDSIFTVSAIALGFWGTAATLLVAIEDRSIVRRLKKGQHFRALVRYIFGAITWQAVVIAVTLAGATFPEPIIHRQLLHRVYAASWIATLLTGVLTTFRAYHCLYEVLKAAATEGQEA